MGGGSTKFSTLSKVEGESRNLFMGSTAMSWMPACAGMTGKTQ
jgi:hypothetical protein